MPRVLKPYKTDITPATPIDELPAELEPREVLAFLGRATTQYYIIKKMMSQGLTIRRNSSRPGKTKRYFRKEELLAFLGREPLPLMYRKTVADFMIHDQVWFGTTQRRAVIAQHLFDSLSEEAVQNLYGTLGELVPEKDLLEVSRFHEDTAAA